nr:type II toxin-antitoxin system ParD family antitoxin [Poseidonocella sp. HB161398]
MPASHARNVALTPELDAFIEELVAFGDFANASEVMRAGLRSLEERREICQIAARIGTALDQLDRGEGISGDPQAVLSGVLDAARGKKAARQHRLRLSRACRTFSNGPSGDTVTPRRNASQTSSSPGSKPWLPGSRCIRDRVRPCCPKEGGRPGWAMSARGGTILILRETETAIELVEVFHERMNIEAWLQALRAAPGADGVARQVRMHPIQHRSCCNVYYS